MPERSEDSYIIHNVIPLFAKLGYPGAGDHERVKVKEVPIYRPSGGRSGSTPDIVYYHREPLLLVEAKREGQSQEQAIEEAENYLRNFPVKDKRYAPSGRPQGILLLLSAERFCFIITVLKQLKMDF